MEFLIFYVFVALILSVAIGSWSERKGQGFAMGFFVSLILSPLIGLIIVAISEDRTAQLKQAQMRKCPQCAELVQPDAKICRYCHYEFPQPPGELAEVTQKRQEETKAREDAARLALARQKVRDRKQVAIILIVLAVVGTFTVILASRWKPQPTAVAPTPETITRDLATSAQPAAPKTTGRPKTTEMKPMEEKLKLEPQRWVRLRYPSGSTPWFVLDRMVSDEEWNAFSVGDTVSPLKAMSGKDTWSFILQRYAAKGAPVGVVIAKIDTIAPARQ